MANVIHVHDPVGVKQQQHRYLMSEVGEAHNDDVGWVGQKPTRMGSVRRGSSRTGQRKTFTARVGMFVGNGGRGHFHRKYHRKQTDMSLG